MTKQNSSSIYNPSVSTRGFTIIELLVVIVIIGILAAIALVSYTGISQKAVVASIKSDLTNSSKLFKMYQIDHGFFPSSLDVNNCSKDASNNVRH